MLMECKVHTTSELLVSMVPALPWQRTYSRVSRGGSSYPSTLLGPDNSLSSLSLSLSLSLPLNLSLPLPLSLSVCLDLPHLLILMKFTNERVYSIELYLPTTHSLLFMEENRLYTSSCGWSGVVALVSVREQLVGWTILLRSAALMTVWYDRSWVGGGGILIGSLEVCRCTHPTTQE